MKCIDRREFLGLAAVGIGGLATSCAPKLNVDRVRRWPHLKSALVLNNLGSISNPNNRGVPGASMLDDRALRDAIDSGVTMINQTTGFVTGPMDPYEYTIRAISRSDEMISAHSDRLLKVRSADDILAAKNQGKIGIVQGFQNTAMLGNDLDRVAAFADLGVRIIQLTYNDQNQVGSGSMVSTDEGLTEFGRDVVLALNDNNVAVDLSHSGERTAIEAIEASSRPVCITHTGARSLSDTPRNKSDKEMRLIADRGGVVGIYFMPFLKEDGFPNRTDVVRHIEHAINVCGEDHVGIGTDGGTTAVDDLSSMRKMIADEVKRRQELGIAATGEKPGVVPFIPDLQGPQQFQLLADLLVSRGHSSRRIEKILGINFFRFYQEVWGDGNAGSQRMKRK